MPQGVFRFIVHRVQKEGRNSEFKALTCVHYIAVGSGPFGEPCWPPRNTDVAMAVFLMLTFPRDTVFLRLGFH